MIDPSHAGAAVGRILLEVGKALGKAVVAGIGLELARAASGQVKKVVGPKDKGKARRQAQGAEADDDGDAERRTATAADVDRIRRENAALREELEALKRELRKVPAEPAESER